MGLYPTPICWVSGAHRGRDTLGRVDELTLRARLSELLRDTCDHLIGLLGALPASEVGLDLFERLADGFDDLEFVVRGPDAELRTAGLELLAEVTANRLVPSAWLNDRVDTAGLLYLLVEASDPDSDPAGVLWRLAYSLRRMGLLSYKHRFAWLYGSRGPGEGDLLAWAARCARADANLGR